MPAGQGFIDTNESSLATAYRPGWPGGWVGVRRASSAIKA